MTPNDTFLKQPKHFWANIRSISQAVGYTERAKGGPGPIKAPTPVEIRRALEGIGLTADHLMARAGGLTALGKLVLEYFAYRADVLVNQVQPLLMDAAQAEQEYNRLAEKKKSIRAVPMNKQSKDKKKPAYFTGIINLLIQANAKGLPCDYDPQQLTTFTLNNAPLRTLARRVDGAFPGPVNPIAVWEIKEYYYTTTFGSRVADGVYETLLDGMELEELREQEKIPVKHYLMVDARYTWWVKGRSYLCRIIDMMHMGYVDEVLFGREVVKRMPAIVKEWVRVVRGRPHAEPGVRPTPPGSAPP